MYTNASDVGLGAVLVQQTGTGTEEILEFDSRTLNQAERNYSSTEKEWFVVVFAWKDGDIIWREDLSLWLLLFHCSVL